MELTAADRKTGTTPNSGDFMTPGNFDFNYDNIGNRLEFGLDEAVPPTPTTYTANDLNEYAATAEPAESFTYDDDGNLTADGTYAYTWDAENRLIQVVTKRAGDPENGDKKLLFAYDYMGRRVFKRVYVYNSGTSTWQLQGTLSRKVIYDGWNPVLVVRGPGGGVTVRKYTWGLDMSGLAGHQSPERERGGGIHGAGGIGGLLAVEETSAEGSPDSWFLYDGNGNVGQVLLKQLRHHARVASGSLAASRPMVYVPDGLRIVWRSLPILFAVLDG